MAGFFGTGAAWEAGGKGVGYGSLPEDDGALAAFAALERWAARF